MWRALRHAAAITILPVTVVVVIPVWIARSQNTPLTLPTEWIGWASLAVGLVLLVAGGVVFAASLRRFHSDGEGTLAPWDPPRNLVVRGPYAYVRNPMISGVILLLIAEGLIARSQPHLLWAGAFLLINSVHIPLVEEPALKKRFGEEYRRYAKHVPRLLPRIRPWRQP